MKEKNGYQKNVQKQRKKYNNLNYIPKNIFYMKIIKIKINVSKNQRERELTFKEKSGTNFGKNILIENNVFVQVFTSKNSLC